MTKAEKKKFDAMESALRVIHIWASVHYEMYFKPIIDHRENLRTISDKCLEALGKKGKT